MRNVEPVREGGCRCGRLRFRTAGKPIVTLACHCKGCQRMTGSAFSLSALYPAASFEVTEGEPVIGGLHGANRHFFCGWCMSWIFSRPDGMDDLVTIRATMFDDASWFVPFAETYTSEKLPWATTPARHSFEWFPPREDLPALAAEFGGLAG
ncbi:GFA family protein [Jiella sp. M17.18]|uniref:GFA family protein n=1 Tax=Jiella sp. M17.18 TaxID=3234247 RepID=UPI0034DF7E21